MSTASTAGCGCGDAAEQLSAVADREQRRVLMIVLAINAALFVGEFGAGWWAGSTALQADSLDSLGDAGVYALSLFVVGRSLQWRAGTAVVKGVIQGLFGIAVLVEVARKAVAGTVPDAPLMAVVAAVAFAAEGAAAPAATPGLTAAVAALFAIAIAAFGGSIGMGLSISRAVEGIARNPEASGKIMTTMIIGLALIESLAIYTLVIIFIKA